jgi:hypothetical protein
MATFYLALEKYHSLLAPMRYMLAPGVFFPIPLNLSKTYHVIVTRSFIATIKDTFRNFSLINIREYCFRLFPLTFTYVNKCFKLMDFYVQFRTKKIINFGF